MNIVAGIVKKHLEVAHDGVGPGPAASHSARLGDLDPSLTRGAHTVMNIDAKWKLGCGRIDCTWI